MAYQPVDLGNIAGAFTSGANAVPDLSARIQALMTTSMGEQGAMGRTMVGEMGAGQRSQLASKTHLKAAGVPETGANQMTLKEAMEFQKTMPAGTKMKVGLSTGEIMELTGAKLTDDEVLDQRALSAWQAWLKTPQAMNKDDNEIMMMLQTIRAALPQIGKGEYTLPAGGTPPQSFMSRAAGAMKNLQLPGLGQTLIGSAGANIAGGVQANRARESTYEQALARLKQMRGQQ